MSARNVTVVCGVSGTGKSIFARRLLLNSKLSTRFMFDAEFSEQDATATEFCHNFGLHPAGDAYPLSLALCKGWVPFDPHERFSGRLADALCFFCEWSYEVSATIPGDKMICVPEVWRYCKPQSIPQELANIVQSGRKRKLHVVVDTQEPNQLHSSILNGASEIVCFKLQSGPALDKVESFGFDPLEVERLQTFEFVARNCDSGGYLRGKIPHLKCKRS